MGITLTHLCNVSQSGTFKCLWREGCILIKVQWNTDTFLNTFQPSFPNGCHELAGVFSPTHYTPEICYGQEG